MRKYSLISTLLLGAILFGFILQGVSPGNGLQEILSKLLKYRTLTPGEKVYLHLDRSVYAAGENIWFSAYLINATDPRSLPASEILYIELLSREGVILDRKVLHLVDGTAHGDFILPKSISDGTYVVRAYTNYMKNFEENWFYQKMITLHSQVNDAKEVSTGNPTVDLQFFPEGGTLLAGLDNRVAFKGSNSLGADVALKGYILDSNQKIITHFESAHSGMGVFRLTPQAGTSYRAVVTNEKDSLSYPLPRVETDGYTLRVDDHGQSIKISVQTTAKQFMGQDAYLIVQSNGMPHYSGRGNTGTGLLVTYVNKDLLPTGIAQITVLDNNLIPQCERLVFVNHSNSPRLAFAFNQPQYQKREKVILKGRVTDPHGVPITGQFSLSVFDSEKIEEVSNYPASIETEFLITSDLKGIIHDPAYYLKDTLQSTKFHLDLLMMTHGWRRFTWKDILADSIPPQLYTAEIGLRMNGKVTLNTTRKNAYGIVKILTPQADVVIVKTTNSGEFSTDELNYYDSAELMVETDNEKGKQLDMKLTLSPFTPSPTFTPIQDAIKRPGLESFTELSNQSRKVDESISLELGNTLLEGVVVKSTKLEYEKEEYPTPLLDKPDLQVPQRRLLDGYSNVVQALAQGVVPGMKVSGSGITLRGYGGPPAALFYDGMRVDYTFLETVNKMEIDHIDIIKEGAYGPNTNGAIAFYTRRFPLQLPDAIGIVRVKYPGLSQAREFYSPNYEIPIKRHSYPDLRTTLYWNPSIRTDVNGNFEVSFYACDVISQYRVVMEGISDAGVPASKTEKLKMKHSD